MGNALFSLAAAMVALAAAGPLAAAFAVPTAWLVVIGAGLVPFGLAVLHLGRRRDTDLRAVRIVVVMDALWVVAAAVILTVPGSMSPVGKLVLGLLTLGVIDWAVLQAIGMRRLATGS
jgi:hypothetical protein